MKKQLNKINLNLKIKGVISRLKKVNPIIVLLLIISILLMLNLFISDRQKEITRWRFLSAWNNLKPKTYIDKKKFSYSCKQEINNEKYKTYLYQSADECKYAGTYRILVESYEYAGKGYWMTGATGNFEKCLQEKLTDAPQKRTYVDKTCNKTVDDTKWLMLFGKKIFKIKTFFY